MTEVGTPREQTLIVDMLDGVLANPQAMNPFFANAPLNEGINNLIYSPLWDVNTATGAMNSMIAAELPEALDKTYTKFRIKLRPNLDLDGRREVHRRRRHLHRQDAGRS